jgi:hypothetical protein
VLPDVLVYASLNHPTTFSFIHLFVHATQDTLCIHICYWAG